MSAHGEGLVEGFDRGCRRVAEMARGIGEPITRDQGLVPFQPWSPDTLISWEMIVGPHCQAPGSP